MTQHAPHLSDDRAGPQEPSEQPSEQLHLDVGVSRGAVLRRTGRVLVALWLLLAVGGVVSIVLKHGLGLQNAFGVVPFLDLDGEASLGTWSASLLLLSCGLLSAACGESARRLGSPWRRNWWVLAAVFVLMSLDEVGRLHDRINQPLQQRLDTSGVLHYAWLIPVLALGAVFLLYQLRFLRSLGRTGRQLFLAGTVFVAGAAGFEMAQGYVIDDTGERSPWDVFPLCEELLELGAVMWVVRILLAHLLAGIATARAAVRP